MKTPEPGLYPGTSEAEYDLWDAARFSLLKLFGKSAAHAHWELTHPGESTGPQKLGAAIHAAILEPERFEAEWVRGLKHGRKLKREREAWDELIEAHPDQEVMKADEYDLSLTLRDEAWKHPTARRLLQNGVHTEVGAIADVMGDIDLGLQVMCKCRVDLLTTLDDWTVVVDIKSARDASPGGFERAVANYDYHQQAAHYLAVLNALAPVDRRFMFIAIEKEPPLVAVYELELDALAQGQREVQSHLMQLALAKKTGVWSGYPAGVNLIGLPRWRRTYDEEF